MTSRQRARRILNHEEADRPAIDLGATRMTGTSAWTYGALKQALGIRGGQTAVPDLFQMLAEVEEPVLDALGCDFAIVPADEANFDEGKISVGSPIAKGLLGLKVGDKAEIKIPAGTLKYKILKISR